MNTVAAQDVAQSRKYRMRWWTLIVLSLSLIIVVIDNTIVNVALPTIQRELDASASALQWIVDSYILVFAALLLTMGFLGDRFGRKRALQAGLAIFGIASLAAAFAQTSGQLTGARVLMGLGGALIMPSTLSVIVDVFPREERAKAIAIWTGVAGLGIPLGPVIGGWLVEEFWWGAVFLLNMPIVLTALVAGQYLVPESRDPSAPRIDVPGAVLSTAALSMLVYAIIEAPLRGWLDPVVLGVFSGALVVGGVFVGYELRTEHPMLDIRLFRNFRLSSGTGAIAAAALALAGLVFLLTQYLQIVRGYTPFEAGVRVIPLAIGFAVGARASSRLIAKLGTKKVVTVGLLVVAAMLMSLSFVGSGTAYWLLGAGLFLFGIGLGATTAASTDAVVAAVPEANAGIGSALNDSARQVGYALGVAILGSVFNSAYSSNIGTDVAGLPADAREIAKNSVGGAEQIAASLGGPAGDALREAASAAFMDAFGAAAIVGAAIAFIGSLLVLRFMPARDQVVGAGIEKQAEADSPSAEAVVGGGR